MAAHPGGLSDGEAYVPPMSYLLRGDAIVFRTATGHKWGRLDLFPSLQGGVPSGARRYRQILWMGWGG